MLNKGVENSSIVWVKKPRNLSQQYNNILLIIAQIMGVFKSVGKIAGGIMMNKEIKLQPLEGEVLTQGYDKFIFNVKQLQIGQEFRNYKALCTYLDEPIKASGKNTQKAQFKEWQRYFNWEKQGHKFIITEVYEIPKEKQDNRRNNTFKTQHVQESFFKEGAELSTTILLYILSSCTLDSLGCEQQLVFKTQEFYNEVGLCNNNYKTLVELHGHYKDVIPPRLSSYVFKEASSKMLQFSQTAFSQMQKQQLLQYQYGKMWIEHVYENPVDKESKGFAVIEHIATKKEVGIIQEGMNFAFEKWNATFKEKQLKNIYNIYTSLNKGERQVVFDWLREYIQKIIPGYEYSCSCHEVVFVPQVIFRELINRGFDENDLLELNSAFSTILKDETKGVNTKFVDYSINRVRDRFNTDMEAYNNWLDETQPKHGRLVKSSNVKQPYRTMLREEDRDLVIKFTGATIKNEPTSEEKRLSYKCFDEATA